MLECQNKEYADKLSKSEGCVRWRGGTFDYMANDIVRSEPCYIMFIAGGENDADYLDDVDLACAPQEGYIPSKTKS